MYQGLETCRVSSPCPCSCPSGGVVTWHSVEVWVVGGGTHQGGVVLVWCGVGARYASAYRALGPKRRVVWVPSS